MGRTQERSKAWTILARQDLTGASAILDIGERDVQARRVERLLRNVADFLNFILLSPSNRTVRELIYPSF